MCIKSEEENANGYSWHGDQHNPKQFRSSIDVLIGSLLTFIFILLSQISLFSASIVLKNKTIEGRIIEEGKESITVKEFVTNKQYKIKRSDITEIKYDDSELKKNREQLEKGEKPDEIPFTEKYKFRMGILPALMIPTGDVGGALGMGLGAQIFGDLLFWEKETSIRAGASLGYYSFPVEATGKTGTLTLLPILLYADAAYPLPSGFKPYAKIGFGLTMASLSGEYDDGESINASSNDLTLSVGIGTAYALASLPNLEFILDVSYMIVFEEVSGNFASISFGVAYRFDKAGEK